MVLGVCAGVLFLLGRHVLRAWQRWQVENELWARTDADGNTSWDRLCAVARADPVLRGFVDDE